MCSLSQRLLPFYKQTNNDKFKVSGKYCGTETGLIKSYPERYIVDLYYIWILYL